MEVHHDFLPAEDLEQLRGLRGQAVVEFIETYEYPRSNAMPPTYTSSTLHFQAPS